MAYTFLKARGAPTGKSRLEEDKVELARDLLTEAANHDVPFVLPSDHIVAVGSRSRSANRDGAPNSFRQNGSGYRPGDYRAISSRGSPARKPSSGTARSDFSRIPDFARGTMAIGEAIANMPGVPVCSVAAIPRRRCAATLGEKLHSYLDRRRRYAGVPRRHRTAGRQGARSLTASRGQSKRKHAYAQEILCRQLENEPGPDRRARVDQRIRARNWIRTRGPSQKTAKSWSRRRF